MSASSWQNVKFWTNGKGACSGKQQTPEISTPTQGCSIRRFQGSTSSSTRLHLQRRCNCLRSSNCNCSWSCSDWTWRKEKNIGINKYSAPSWSFPALFTLKPQQNVVRTKMCHWCSYQVLASSVIYSWTDPWQNKIHMFSIIKTSSMSLFSHRSLERANQNACVIQFMIYTLFNSLIWLLILISSCHTFPCKLVRRIWC